MSVGQKGSDPNKGVRVDHNGLSYHLLPSNATEVGGNEEDKSPFGNNDLSGFRECSASYAPLATEWLLVPRFQRWGIWWRAAEVAGIGSRHAFSLMAQEFEGYSSGIQDTHGIDISPDGIRNSARILSEQLGHPFPPREIVGIRKEGAVANHGAIQDVISFNPDLFLEFSKRANTLSGRPLREELQKFLHYVYSTLTHELKHRDNNYPFLLAEEDLKALHKLLEEQAPDDVIQTAVANLKTKLLRQATSLWNNFSADSRVVLAQQVLTEGVEGMITTSEADAYLTSYIFDGPGGNNSLTYTVGVKGEVFEYVVPKPLRNTNEARKRFWFPSTDSIPFRMAYTLSRSRPVFVAFRSVEILGNCIAPIDIVEWVHVIQDPNQNGIDVSLQGAVVATSVPASAIGTAALFATDKLAYLRVAGPLATVSGAALATKESYDTWRREDTSGEERLWSTTAAVSSTAAAGAAIGMAASQSSLAFFVPAGAAATTSSGGLLLPVVLVAGLAIMIGSQLAKYQAQEERLAAQLADAFEKGDFERLDRFAQDPYAEFDDDVAMKFFEEHVLPRKWLYHGNWQAPQLRNFRKKLIDELGSGYVSDLEGAYSLFVADRESFAEASRIRDSVGAGALKLYNKYFIY